MNILIFEYITGGGMKGELLPKSLVNEGELMLNAIVNDFSEIEGINVHILRDNRLDRIHLECTEHRVGSDYDYHQIIDNLSENLDALLIVAPETNNILALLCEKYSQYNFSLLNSTCSSIYLTGNKFKTYKYLKEHNVMQIPSYELSNVDSIHAERIIVKPKDGVGCEELYLLDKKEDLSASIAVPYWSRFLVQPYLAGQSASLSLLCLNGDCRLLSANKLEVITTGNHLSLRKCVVNALQPLLFIDFAKSLVCILPELKGYIGVDILVANNEIYLIEINPRLTTSYAGLKRALGINTAELMLEVFMNNTLPEFKNSGKNSIEIELGDEYCAY